MRFVDPHMLFLLWAVLIAAGLVAVGIRKRRSVLLDFASRTAFETLSPGAFSGRRAVKGALLAAALFFLCISLSGPLFGYRWEQVRQRGVDIMVALDCSRSMLCEDVKPSRLERAKREIVDLLRMMKSDRAGLVAFSGEAILQCPLTLDHDAFNIFLDVLEPDYLPKGGTNLSAAIDTCLDGFETDVDSGKAVILITDGEETSGMSFDAVKRAAETGVKICCIGVGSPDGAPVPAKDGGFVKDAGGSMVLSKVDEPGLRKIAAMTDGVYVRSVAGDMDLDTVYTREIREKMQLTALESTRKKVWENRYQWFLLPCILLLLAEIAIRPQKLPGGMRSVAAAAVVLLALTPATAQAGERDSVRKGIEAYKQQAYDKSQKHFIDAQLKNPDNPDHYYNIGVAAYKKGDWETALDNFTRALETADDETLQHKARYNIGNARYRQGDLEGAVKAYEKVLKAWPADTEAKENLSFVKERLQQKKEEKRQESQRQSGEDKKEKQQQREGAGKEDKQGQSGEKQKNKDGKQQERTGDKAGQERKNPEKKAGKERNQKKDRSGQGAERGKEDGKQAAGKQKAAAGDRKGAENGKSGRRKGAENTELDSMLNRLSDRPGKAMMPVYREKTVEKDW